MAEAMGLMCVCGYTTKDAEEFVAHMMASGHGLDPELRVQARDGKMFSEMVEHLRKVQFDPEGAMAEPVDEDDEDIPPTVHYVQAQLDRREKLRRQLAKADFFLNKLSTSLREVSIVRQKLLLDWRSTFQAKKEGEEE